MSNVANNTKSSDVGRLWRISLAK